MPEYEIHFETGDVLAIEGDKPPGPEAIAAAWNDYRAGRTGAADLATANPPPEPPLINLPEMGRQYRTAGNYLLNKVGQKAKALVGDRAAGRQAIDQIISGRGAPSAMPDVGGQIIPSAETGAGFGQVAPDIGPDPVPTEATAQGLGSALPEGVRRLIGDRDAGTKFIQDIISGRRDPHLIPIVSEVLINVAGMVVGVPLASLGRMGGIKLATLLANSAAKTSRVVQLAARAAPGAGAGAGFFGGMRGTTGAIQGGIEGGVPGAVKGGLTGLAKGAAFGGLVGAVGLVEIGHPLFGYLARWGIITGGDVVLDSERYKFDSLGNAIQGGISLVLNGLFALGKAPTAKMLGFPAPTSREFKAALDTLERVIKTKGRAAAIETPEGAAAFKTVQEVLGGKNANQELKNLIRGNLKKKGVEVKPEIKPKPAPSPQPVTIPGAKPAAPAKAGPGTVETRAGEPAPAGQSLDEVIREVGAPAVARAQAKARPPIRAAVGRDTRVVVENEAPHPAKYAVVEAESLIPSHVPTKGYAPHPKYPKGVQERDYRTDKQAQAEIQVRAQEGDSPRNMDPSRLITDNPTPVEGPPIVSPSGLILGGNSRAMTILLHYRQHGQNYRQYLLENAERFGLNPAEIENTKAPVLVRLRGEAAGQQEAQRLVRQYNQVGTRELSAAERAATAAKNVSPGTLEALAQRLDAGGDISTIRSILGKSPKFDGELVNRLVADGVLTPGEVKRYLVAGRGITEDGKRLIEEAVLGTVIKDAGALATTPPSIREKISKALGPIAAIKARGGEWNILPDLARAAELATKARQMDMDVDGFLSQQSMFGGPQYSDVAVGLARLFLDRKTKPLTEALKRWASAARADVKNQAAMFGKPTPATASRDIFGVEAAPDVAEVQYLKTKDSIYREKPYIPGIPEPGAKPASLNEVVANLKAHFETIALKAPLNRYDEALYLTIKDVIKYKKNQAFFHEIGHVAQNPRKPFAEPLQITPRHLKKFTGELAGLAPEQPLTEGFAEFMRLWIVDYDQALRRAHNLLQHFETNAAKDPKMWSALNRFREMTEAYFQQTTYADIAGMIGPPGGGPISMRQRMELLKKTWDDTLTGVWNKDHPIFKLEDRVNKALGDMLPTENFGMALEAMRGLGVKVFGVLEDGLLADPAQPSKRVIFDRKTFDQTGKLVPGTDMPLTPKEIFKRLENEVEQERFSVYILAKRGEVYEEKRAMRLFGPNVAEGGPAKVVAELDKTHPHFKRIAVVWDAISKTLLTYKWRSGLVDTKLFHVLHDEYPFYVSLGRYMDDIMGAYQGSGREGVRQLIKKIGGSERQIRPPMESLLKDIFETYHVGDRNRFFNLLDKPAAKMPGIWIEEKPPKYFKSWTDDKGVKHVQITSGKVGPDVVDFFKNGERVYRKVLDMPLLKSLRATGENLIANLTAIDGVAGKLVDAILFGTARLKRAGMTKSTGWQILNFFKDGTTVCLTSEATYLQVPWLRGILAVPDVFGRSKVFKDLMASGMGGSTQAGFNQEVYARTLKDLNNRVQAGGGKVVSNPAHLMALALKNVATGHLIRGAKTTWEVAEVLSQASEYLNRVGEAKAIIKKYMKQGMSYDDALMVAMRAGRRVSLDFQQQGAWTLVNLWTKGTPFLTSNLQGALRWSETYFSPKAALPGGLTGAKKLKRNWTRLFIYTVIPTLIIWATHKDDPWWQSLEPWQKFGYYNFRLGGEKISFSKSWEFALFANLVEGILTEAQAKDSKAAGNIAWAILNAFSISADTLIPQAARLVIEPLTGVELWTGRSVVSPRDSSGVPEHQVNFFTGPAERMLAGVLNNAFGIPLKAAYIGHMVKLAAGNLGEMAVQFANAVASGATGKNYDLPTRSYWRRFLTGRFIKDQTTYTRAMDRFYGDWKRVKQLLSSANRADRRMRPDEAEQLVATKIRLWGPEFKTIWEKRDQPIGPLSGIKRLRLMISEFGSAMDRIRFNKDIPAETRQKQIHWLMYGMINAVQRYYGLEKLIVEAPIEEPPRDLLERPKTRWNKPPPPRIHPPRAPSPNVRRQPSVLDHTWSKP